MTPATFVLVFIGVLAFSFIAGNFLAWFGGRHRYAAHPWNWRAFLGSDRYIDWLEVRYPEWWRRP